MIRLPTFEKFSLGPKLGSSHRSELVFCSFLKFQNKVLMKYVSFSLSLPIHLFLSLNQLSFCMIHDGVWGALCGFLFSNVLMYQKGMFLQFCPPKVDVCSRTCMWFFFPRKAACFDANTLPASPSALSDPLLHHIHCRITYRGIHNDFTLQQNTHHLHFSSRKNGTLTRCIQNNMLALFLPA